MMKTTVRFPPSRPPTLRNIGKRTDKPSLLYSVLWRSAHASSMRPTIDNMDRFPPSLLLSALLSSATPLGLSTNLPHHVYTICSLLHTLPTPLSMQIILSFVGKSARRESTAICKGAVGRQGERARTPPPACWLSPVSWTPSPDS